jgi:O-methyltransferase
MADGPHEWRSDLRHEFALRRARLDGYRMAVARSLGLPRDPEWRRLLAMTDGRTMVDRTRRANLLRLIGWLDRERVPGALAECGVARGGVAALLGARALTSPVPRDVWLFDSFVGLPAPTAEDGAPAVRFAHNRGDGRLEPIGECVGTLEDVRGFLFGDCRLPEDRIHLVPGWFQDTLPTYAGGPIALAHLDGDWYESVRTCLVSLWSHMSPGGYVVIDDYGHWEGAGRATREFLARNGRGILLHRKGYTQAYFRKPL